jgi:hypothetical protein
VSDDRITVAFEHSGSLATFAAELDPTLTAGEVIWHLQRVLGDEQQPWLPPAHGYTLIPDRTSRFIRSHETLADTGVAEGDLVRVALVPYEAGLAEDINRREPLAFLCHASDDKVYVRRLERRMRRDGIRTWLDERELLPGREWNPAIEEAVRAADVVIVCLSRASISRSGYVQKELRLVLDVADEQPEGGIFVIPAKIEPCQVPDRLCRWHWVDLRQRGGYIRLVAAVRQAAATRADRPSEQASRHD